MGRQKTKISFSKSDIDILKHIADIKATQYELYQEYNNKEGLDVAFLIESETDFSFLIIDRIIKHLNIKGVPDKKILEEFKEVYNESEV